MYLADTGPVMTAGAGIASVRICRSPDRSSGRIGFLTRAPGAARLAVVKLSCWPLALLAAVAVPLPDRPDWNSNDTDYSTGGSFCDVNGNGLLDYVVSNGNDMASDRNAVYLNLGGTYETTASWRSDDRGMFGHCYTGDVTGDGRPDLAVITLGPDSSQTPLIARLYRNTGPGFEKLPGWRAADRHSSFDCCFGDVNLNGRLDLAVSAGDAYTSRHDPARVYFNTGGTLDTLPAWAAVIDTASCAIRFCDIDDDGDLDLFVGHRRQVSMFRNNGGVLDTVPAWTVRRGVGWVLRLAFGDYDQDGWPDLAVASNGQLGDSNNIRVYRNNNGVLDTIPAFVMLRTSRYSSCVAWGDVDGDGYPELAAGGWWEPAVVFRNNAGVLSTTPDWSWRPVTIQRLVCETVMWADVGNRYIEAATAEYAGNGERRLWSLPRAPVQFIDSVTVDEVAAPTGSWTADPLAAWFSLAESPAPGAAVTCHYRFSSRLDLAVTNWDKQVGTRNLLFFNTTPTGINEGEHAPVLARLDVRPNPSRGPVRFALARGQAAPAPLGIYANDGRLVRRLAPDGNHWHWDGSDDDGRSVVPGVYFAQLGAGRVKVVITR